MFPEAKGLNGIERDRKQQPSGICGQPYKGRAATGDFQANEGITERGKGVRDAVEPTSEADDETGDAKPT